MYQRPRSGFEAHIIERRYPYVVELADVGFGLKLNLHFRWCRERCQPSEWCQTDREGPLGQSGYYLRYCFLHRSHATEFAEFAQRLERMSPTQLREMCHAA